MKLVDILARELSEWVAWGEKIVQDDDGYIVAFETDAELKCVDGDWKGPSCDPICVLDLADDYKTSIVTRAQWQAAVDALKAEKEFAPFDFSGPVLDYGPKEWTGEGLPPRGTKCEVQPWKEHEAPWVEVEFIASWLAPNGLTYSWVHTGYGWKEPQMFRFRPIRTPEQIEQEISYRAICQLMDDLDIPSAIAARAYDLGYRKFEIVEE